MAHSEDNGTDSNIVMNLIPDTYIDLSKRGLTGTSVSQSHYGTLCSNAVTLNLNENSFHEIPVNVFDIQCLESLSMKSQKCSRRASFPGFATSFNQISSDIYRLKQLRELDFSDNEISEFPSDAACELKELHTINLDLNTFTVFPICFIEMRSLRKLSLSGNKITQLPDDIGSMTELEELRISNNKLNSLPYSLCQLQNLTILSLRYNSIAELPKRFADLVGLGKENSELNLEENPWRWPPNDVVLKSFDAIKLYIKDTGTGLPAQETEKHEPSRQMSTMSLGQRQRSNSTESLGPLKEEKEIESLSRTSVKMDVRDFHLKKLPKIVAEFNNLQQLYLDKNILEFDDELCSLLKNCRLKHLSIQSQGRGKAGMWNSMHGNTLTEIPNCIVYLDHLQELYLADNAINKVSKDIAYLKHLKVLELSYNKLEIFPEVLCKLEKLEYLGLSNNKIFSLPESIGLMKNLKILRLSFNKIQHLPDTICHLTTLQMLSLRSNHLAYLPFILDEMCGLLHSGDDYYVSYLDRTMKSGIYLDKNSKLKFPADNACQLDTKELFETYRRKRNLDKKAFWGEYEAIVGQFQLCH